MKRLSEYIQGLTVSQGPLAGQAVKLLPWGKRFLKGAFGPEVSTAALSIARGNGKSTLTAGIGAACLDGPLAQPGAEVIVVASSFGQARIIFEYCKEFLEAKLEGAPRV